MGLSASYITIVSPVYKAENIVEDLVLKIESSVNQITNNYRIVLVNDGSPDRSWKVIQKICASNQHVTGVNLSRNFGQHHAITAGLSMVNSDWTVVMDCDLQDKPDQIIKLYQEAQKGYDIVWASRLDRKDPFLKKLSSKVFYGVFNYLTGVKYDPSVANFGIFKKKVIDSYLQMKEPMRAFPIMLNWLGYNKSVIKVEHAGRKESSSSYTLKKLLKLASDLILAYSNKPLKIVIYIGFYISIAAILFGVYNIYLYLNGEIKQEGYASIIVSLWFLAGLIIFICGVIGLYISKIFEGVKNRPIYLISDILNDK